MKRTLGLTGVTVNAMALIAPGAFLWTTFQTQAALDHHGVSTANEMWTGLLFSLVLAMLTAYSYAELARLYPDAGTGSSYYFAEAAFLDKERAEHQRYARAAKLSVGWISHLYYWIYPGIMVAFTATLFGYLYSALAHHTLTWLPLSLIAIGFALMVGYIAYLGITGSTVVSVVINVIQITCLLAISVVFIWFRLAHPHPATAIPGPAYENAGLLHVLIPHNLVNMIYQSTVAILLLVGFESVTALGAEAKNPDKDIKRGVLISLLIQGGVCYLFEYLAANYVIGSATITNIDPTTNHLIGGYPAAANAKGTSAPIGDMIHNIFQNYFSHTGTTMAVIVAFTVLLALIGTNLACVNAGVRITYTMSKDREMPSVLGWLHDKWATPHGAIIVMTVIAAALGVFGVNPYQVDNLTQITLASNIGTFLVYGSTCIIALVAFAGRSDRHPIKHLFVPGIGALLNIFEMLAVFYIAFSEGTGTTPGDAEKAIGVVVLWIILGVVWVKTNPNRHTRRQEMRAKQAPTAMSS